MFVEIFTTGLIRMGGYRDTNAWRLFQLFGGLRSLARELGVSTSVLSRWNSHAARGNHGRVPPHYNIRIMERARALGLDLHQVGQCLDDHLCPCCKRPLEPGMTIDRQHLRIVLSGLEGGAA